MRMLMALGVAGIDVTWRCEAQLDEGEARTLRRANKLQWRALMRGVGQGTALARSRSTVKAMTTPTIRTRVAQVCLRLPHA
jgi:hypothetical protein